MADSMIGNEKNLYVHLELKKEGYSVEAFEYSGRYLLLNHFWGSNAVGPFVIVEGYITGMFMIPRENKLPATEVSIISDNTEKKELTDLLRQRGEKKLIIFG